MRLEELQALERDHVIGTYARNPVQFVRGEGTRLWDEHGDEYLDFLAGISVLNVGHCHPRVVRGGPAPGGDADPRLQPLLHGRRDAAVGGAGAELARRQGVPLQLGHRSQRSRDQARPAGASRRQPDRARGGVPRPHLRLAVGDPAGVQAGAVRAAGPGLSDGRQGSGGAARRGRREHRRGAAGTDPGGDRDPRAVRRTAARRPRGVRSDRRGADLRRGPERDGPHRHRLGLRADAGGAGRADQRQGPRRRAADRSAGHRRTARRRPAARRPRLDVRRRTAGLRRGAGGARDLLRRRAVGARSERSASGCGRRSPSCRRSPPSAGAG